MQRNLQVNNELQLISKHICIGVCVNLIVKMGAVDNKYGYTLQSNEKKRKWIYAKKPSGKLYNYRQIVGYGLLLFLVIAPFLKINGNPFLMFNIVERKFSIFGNVFFPQDLH